jgi:hypothetical protein
VPVDSDPDWSDHARGTPADPESRDAPETPSSPRSAADGMTQDGCDARMRTETPDIRQMQVDAQIRNRQVVDAAYQAAPGDAWAGAAPKMRAAWEELKGVYPEGSNPTPRLEPDGSWSCGETRKLSSDQNAEVDHEYTRVREVGRNDIVPALRAIEAEDPTRQLAGFENRFKGEDRLKEKIADQLRSTPGITPTQAITLIPDAVRFTLQYPDAGYTAGVLKDTERLKEHGFTLIERRNTWTSDQYKGINSRWQEPKSGVIFEVQFHTEASLEAKELTHEAYQRIRRPAKDPELAELRAFQRSVNSVVPVPPDVTKIDDYPPGET